MTSVSKVTDKVRRLTRTPKGLWSLGAAAAVLLSGVLIFIWLVTGRVVVRVGDQEKWVELNTEMFKIGLQLLGVGVLGGAAKVLYERYQDHRERRDIRRETQRKFLEAVVGAYHQTKQNRRLLRARAFSWKKVFEI